MFSLSHVEKGVIIIEPTEKDVIRTNLDDYVLQSSGSI